MRILVLPGDGIGPEITAASVPVRTRLAPLRRHPPVINLREVARRAREPIAAHASGQAVAATLG